VKRVQWDVFISASQYFFKKVLVPFPALFFSDTLLLRWYLLLFRWEKSAPLLPGLKQGRGAGREWNPGLPQQPGALTTSPSRTIIIIRDGRV
jgi:hypothetical protein